MHDMHDPFIIFARPVLEADVFVLIDRVAYRGGRSTPNYSKTHPKLMHTQRDI